MRARHLGDTGLPGVLSVEAEKEQKDRLLPGQPAAGTPPAQPAPRGAENVGRDGEIPHIKRKRQRRRREQQQQQQGYEGTVHQTSGGHRAAVAASAAARPQVPAVHLQARRVAAAHASGPGRGRRAQQNPHAGVAQARLLGRRRRPREPDCVPHLAHLLADGEQVGAAEGAHAQPAPHVSGQQSVRRPRAAAAASGVGERRAQAGEWWLGRVRGGVG